MSKPAQIKHWIDIPIIRFKT
uniref:Uncharacterized protein n=1 Tax=Arundo donax TaxID=35708 RepID=A0A0A9BKL0_ARUDO